MPWFIRRHAWHDERKRQMRCHGWSEGMHDMMSGNDKCDAMIHQKACVTWWAETTNVMPWFIRRHAWHDERKRQMWCHDSSEGMHDMMSGNDKCDAMIHQKACMAWWAETTNAMPWFIRRHAWHDERKRQMWCHDSSEGMHDKMSGNDKCDAMIHQKSCMTWWAETTNAVPWFIRSHAWHDERETTNAMPWFIRRHAWHDERKRQMRCHGWSEGMHDMMSGNNKCDAMIHHKACMTWWAETTNVMPWFIRRHAWHGERKRQMRCHDSSEGMHDMKSGNDKCDAMIHQKAYMTWWAETTAAMPWFIRRHALHGERKRQMRCHGWSEGMHDMMSGKRQMRCHGWSEGMHDMMSGKRQKCDAMLYQKACMTWWADTTNAMPWFLRSHPLHDKRKRRMGCYDSSEGMHDTMSGNDKWDAMIHQKSCMTWQRRESNYTLFYFISILSKWNGKIWKHKPGGCKEMSSFFRPNAGGLGGLRGLSPWVQPNTSRDMEPKWTLGIYSLLKQCINHTIFKTASTRLLYTI